MRKQIRHISPILLLLACIVTACSTKKNTAGSRFWQAFNTRYNVYYNGKTHYDEQIKIVEQKYDDDYSQRLFIHPAEAYAVERATKPSGNFDRTIEKMQKAIALHSIKKKPKRKAGKSKDQKEKEWLKREEYNPFLHNAWFTMAKAQYMKGDFLSAAATFHYISRHFKWLPDLVVESQIWESLCYCAMDWTTEADNLLTHVHPERITDGNTLALYNLTMADYLIHDKRYAEATPFLRKAADKAKGAQKVRLNFLLGQLYADTDQNDLAYQAFKRAGSSSGSSYRTKFNARIKQSAVFAGKDIRGEVKALKAMTRYDRNKEYLDQIYYAIGNLYLSRKDTVKAIDNYVLAAEKSTRNGIDKAISQITLGGIYFAQHRYDLAQPCYSEAVPKLGEDYPNYKEIKRRSDVLDELAVYSQNVTLQDSLLRLAKMTPEQQKAVVKKIIEALKKKEKEEAAEAKLQEQLANQSANQPNNTSKANQPNAFQMNNDKSWYFYNNATKNAGKTEFQRRWGNRKLEDNWRRRNKAVYAVADESSDDETTNLPNDSVANDSVPAMDKEALKRAEDPHYEEYYLKQIPKTEEEISNSHSIIQEGLYNMGLILKDKLEDYPSSFSEFNELLRRYPDNIYRLDTYYNMYLMYMRMGDIANAEKYRSLILSEFADSKYGVAMKDPNYIDNLRSMEANQEVLYEQAYEAYLNNKNNAVHAAYHQMAKQYPLSKIMPKFMFLHALAYVTEKDYTKFQATLKEMLERYPETDMTPMASSIVKQMNQGRVVNGGGSNTRGILWDTRLSNDTTAAGGDKKATPFSADRTKPHYLVMAYPTDSVSANELLYNVARFNFSTFVVKDFDLEQMTFGRMGLLLVKGFANYDELAHYRSVFEANADFTLPKQVRLVMISVDNFNLLLNEGRSLEEYFEFLEGNNTKKVEKQVPELKPDEATPEGENEEEIDNLETEEGKENKG